MLHIINSSPYQSSRLQECLQICQANDVLLLLADGVYAALSNTDFYKVLIHNMSEIKVFVLEEDAIARGIRKRIGKKIPTINYDDFVTLTIKHHPCYTWM